MDYSNGTTLRVKMSDSPLNKLSCFCRREQRSRMRANHHRSATTLARPAGTVENSPGVHSWERGATHRVLSPVGTAEPAVGPSLLQSSLRDWTSWVGYGLDPRNEFLGYYRSSPTGRIPIGKLNHLASVLFSDVLSVRNPDWVFNVAVL